MITEEQFNLMVDKVSAGGGLTNEEATDLIQTLAELDQRGLVAEQIVEFVLLGAEQVYDAVADKVLKELQLRDHAKVKRIVSIGKNAAAQLTAATHLYIAQQYLNLQQGEALAEVDTNVPDEEVPA